jgi:hypothetical protein
MTMSEDIEAVNYVLHTVCTDTDHHKAQAAFDRLKAILTAKGEGTSAPEVAKGEEEHPRKTYSEAGECADLALRALVLTRDYLGAERMPAIKGWEWFDACEKLSAWHPYTEWAKQYEMRKRAVSPTTQSSSTSATAPPKPTTTGLWICENAEKCNTPCSHSKKHAHYNQCDYTCKGEYNAVYGSVCIPYKSDAAKVEDEGYTGKPHDDDGGTYLDKTQHFFPAKAEADTTCEHLKQIAEHPHDIYCDHPDFIGDNSSDCYDERFCDNAKAAGKCPDPKKKIRKVVLHCCSDCKYFGPECQGIVTTNPNVTYGTMCNEFEEKAAVPVSKDSDATEGKVKKENKFIVVKREHIENYLTDEAQKELYNLLNNLPEKVRNNKYVVCNQDEPYAEAVWQMILDGERKKKEVVQQLPDSKQTRRQTQQPSEIREGIKKDKPKGKKKVR